MRHKYKLLLLLALICIISICFSYCSSKTQNISEKQIEIDYPTLTKDSNNNDYFELQGFGKIEINLDNQYLYLINPKNNNVYLKFKVLCNNKCLYETELIESGKMELFNIYNQLENGEYEICYLINVYDENQKIIWKGIEQTQEISIS